MEGHRSANTKGFAAKAKLLQRKAKGALATTASGLVAKKSEKLQVRRKNYHAVSIVAGADACDSSRAIRPFRFLDDYAPLLPLKECSKFETCSCIYLHHDDRREQDRRRRLVIHQRNRRHQHRRNEGYGRRNNSVPTRQEFRNALRELQALIDRLVDGDPEVTLDDLNVSLDSLRDSVEYRVLVDRPNSEIFIKDLPV